MGRDWDGTGTGLEQDFEWNIIKQFVDASKSPRPPKSSSLWWQLCTQPNVPDNNVQNVQKPQAFTQIGHYLSKRLYEQIDQVHKHFQW